MIGWKHSWVARLSAISVLAAAVATTLRAGEEGGYAGTTDEGHDTVVYNFLKQFSYEDYYYSAESQWTWNNDSRVDNMDIAIFAGHGNQWLIVGEDGISVDLSTAGDSSDLGYGDDDCEFVAFESCNVVPSPHEVSDWYTNWTHADGIFDGLHQAMGFHTLSWQSTDQKISKEFGERVEAGDDVWSSWFDAIDTKGRSIELGCAVMNPDCDGDTYYSFAADPSAGSTALRLYHQD